MNILVLRTSAMGDVALVVPVLKGLVQQYPNVKITLVTHQTFSPFFNTMPGIKLVCPEFKARHKGLIGIFRLFRDLNKIGKYDYIIDLHDVLRTKVLRFLYKMYNIPLAIIDKGRDEKKALIQGKSKKQLKHTVERYCDVFAKAELPVIPSKDCCFIPSDDTLIKVSSFFMFGDDNLNIGVAPYAKHALKMWPTENMIKLLNMISERQRVKFWLFGGYNEIKGLYNFNEKFPSAFLVAGKLNLEEELAIMGKLDFMIAMDSSNMHMAALAGTKVVSIWGATDPLSGFSAWQQPDSYSIRIEDLACRPCTIFGKGKCKRGDMACMQRLSPEMVFNKLIINELI